MTPPPAGATTVIGGTGRLGMGVVRALTEAGHDLVFTWRELLARAGIYSFIHIASKWPPDSVNLL
jgi:hypothetical protein